MADPTHTHGWTAVPRDTSTLLNGKKNVKDPEPVTVDSIPLPNTPLAKKVLEYAQKELREETFNHSMRVFYYGLGLFQSAMGTGYHALSAIFRHIGATPTLKVSTILDTLPSLLPLFSWQAAWQYAVTGQAIHRQQFPDWQLSDETYLLTCLLHDIGTTDKNMPATLMSFEFYGGYLALDLLKKELYAEVQQAEAVAEAIIRHQDIGDSGNITTLGQLIQLATIFDNMGGHEDLVHKGTIEDVVKHYPRKKWSSCFAATIRKEVGLKPWAHTTALGEEDFPGGVENNKLMEPYDV